MKFARESYEKEVINHPLIKPIRSYEKKQIESIIFQLPKYWRVLDVGCGGGFYTRSLVKHFQQVSALDKSNDFFKEWDVNEVEPIHMNFLECSREFIEKFDLIILLGVYEFISESDEKAALERFSWASNIVIVSASPDISSLFYRATHIWKNRFLLKTLDERRLASLKSLKKNFFEKKIYPHNKMVALTSEVSL